jgi:hypothetical protein
MHQSKKSDYRIALRGQVWLNVSLVFLKPIIPHFHHSIILIVSEAN